MNPYISKEMKRYNHLMSEIEAAYHQMSLKLGISDSAMIILYTICDTGDCCLLQDICRRSGISKQTINSAIRKLEAENDIFASWKTGARTLCNDRSRSYQYGTGCSVCRRILLGTSGCCRRDGTQSMRGRYCAAYLLCPPKWQHAAAYGVLMYVSLIFQAVFIGYHVGTAPVISYHYGAGAVTVFFLQRNRKKYRY